jgi:hypothetical protein
VKGVTSAVVPFCASEHCHFMIQGTPDMASVRFGNIQWPEVQGPETSGGREYKACLVASVVTPGAFPAEVLTSRRREPEVKFHTSLKRSCHTELRSGNYGV